MSARQAPDRNIALELVRVTEAGAMAAARWIGRGEKESADGAAVDAMRFVLDSVSMRGVVVIGEGEKDEAPMLYNGEEVGNGEGPEVDVAVDPLEGTRLTAFGQPNAIAVIAVAERGTMLFPGAAVYMEKIAVGPDAIDAIDIERSPTENVVAVAEALGKTPREVDVVVLERERHDDLIAELRDAGARVRLIRDGDVAPAIAAAQPGTGVDMLYGIGGTPEGVISAAALKCVGGGIQGRLWPRSDDERQQLLDAGLDPARVLHTDDLVSGEDVFVAATGVTTGSLLQGVRYTPGGAVTDSIVMRSRSGTVRRVVAQQSLAKLSAMTGFEYTLDKGPMDEAQLEDTPYGRNPASGEGWFVLNLADALAVRNEVKGGAIIPLEPRGRAVRGLRRQRPRRLARRAERPLPLRERARGVPRALGGVHADRRGAGAAAAPVGLLPLPGRHAPHLRRRRRGAVRDPHDRRSARRAAQLSRERGRREARRLGREGDPEPGRGVRRLAGRVTLPVRLPWPVE